MRNTIIDPPIGTINVQTFNGFEYDESREAMKIAIRRSLTLEVMFWVMEALRTNVECRRETIKELLLCACFEIGPANPSLIIVIDDMIARDVVNPNYDEVLIAVELLTISPKCRLFAWMNDYYINKSKDITETYDIRLTLMYISVHLDDGNFDNAVLESAKLLVPRAKLIQHDWKKLCDTFSNPSRIQKFYSPLASIWIPILSKAERCGSQKACNLVHRIYNIACLRNIMNNDSRLYSLCIYGLWVLCNIKTVEDTWYQDKLMRLKKDTVIMPDVDRQYYLNRHLNREFILELPKMAINMYTSKGLKLGSDIKKFASSSGRIFNVLPEYAYLEHLWLKKVIKGI